MSDKIGSGEKAAGLAKRFYKEAEAAESETGWTVMLDGRAIRTPAKADFLLPAKQLAEAVAAEWNAQAERIDPETMPLTRIANTGLDRVSGREQAIADEIAAFAASDLLCYRAEGPAGLVAAQAAAWDPVLAWCEKELGAAFTPATGIIHKAQPETSLKRIREDLGWFDALALSALHTVTTLTGSALLALALAKGQLTPDQAWAAAHVDEDWQISQWGEDAEARARREARRVEFEAADRFLKCLAKR